MKFRAQAPTASTICLRGGGGGRSGGQSHRKQPERSAKGLVVAQKAWFPYSSPFQRSFLKNPGVLSALPFALLAVGPKYLSVFVRIRYLGALRHEPTQMAVGEAFLGCCFMHQMLKYVWVETTEACLV